ncbi:hypothetical protein GUJ93_ZPchr0926g7125 [Zizania palustris]|uniref:Secreted protein n=1 Tax=Zizania palustris TaxID=103762 RepID=A0A8J5UZD5_ZIZPA|nr:hypothetical protein GUJ93_ZPchr0677g2985 [Zizania palustris]KAG8043155.1 hypothetical protein GUJ93_ZPchr0926g7125 [Zizania palustris]
MEGKRTTTLMVIMCLVILSLSVNSATAAQCGCCISFQAKHVVNFVLLRVDPTQSARTLVVSHVFWLIPLLLGC